MFLLTEEGVGKCDSRTTDRKLLPQHDDKAFRRTMQDVMNSNFVHESWKDRVVDTIKTSNALHWCVSSFFDRSGHGFVPKVGM